MDAVVRHIVESTAFAVAAAAFTLLFRRNRAAVRYAIWCTASAKFLVPFAAVALLARQLPGVSFDHAGAGALAGLVFRTTARADVAVPYQNLIACVWAAGALAVAARWTVEWCRIAALIRRAPRVIDGPVHDAIAVMRAACPVARPVELVVANITREPGVFGISRPVLLWPAHLTALRPEQIEAVVAHEVAHVARRDNLHASIHMLVSAIFWFHPLVWWIGARLIDERERACDERVLALGQRPAAYAASLLDTCRQCISSTLANVPGVTGGNLSRRIAHIMGENPAVPLGRSKKGVLVAAALCALVPAMTTSAPAQTKDAEETVQAGPDVEMPRLLREVKPQYTERALREKVQGEVTLQCIVRTTGRVTDIKVVRSLDPDLDKAAVDAASQWEFEPGKRKGKPVNVQVTITVAFTLKRSN
jgi:TonB family protein